jgi:hypothetical protein
LRGTLFAATSTSRALRTSNAERLGSDWLEQLAVICILVVVTIYTTGNMYESFIYIYIYMLVYRSELWRVLTYISVFFLRNFRLLE